MTRQKPKSYEVLKPISVLYMTGRGFTLPYLMYFEPVGAKKELILILLPRVSRLNFQNSTTKVLIISYKEYILQVGSVEHLKKPLAQSVV